MDNSSLLTYETAIQVMDKVCLVLTLFVHSSGIAPCIDMYNKQDTTNVPIHTFFVTAASCAGMFHYGTLIANTTILLINGVGTILQCCYILLYMLVMPEVSTIVPVLAAAGLYESVLYYYIFAIATDEGEVTAALGSTSSLLNMLNITILAQELINNLRNRDANGTPTVMVVSGMAAALSWLIYGLMLQDPYIYVPNIPALIVGAGKTYATLAFDRDKDIKTI